jgi:hypothetical protein
LQKYCTCPRKDGICTSLDDVTAYPAKYASFNEYPMNLAVISAAAEITDVPELHDRLMAGIAKLLDAALITNDSALQASSFVKTT